MPLLRAACTRQHVVAQVNHAAEPVHEIGGQAAANFVVGRYEITKTSRARLPHASADAATDFIEGEISAKLEGPVGPSR